ncbi:DUF2490 domain-containing protein [Flavobacterium sp.]|uniref:DUF2490 domain-containing protein n=1 Tax=Flavobacterium sp. TaxID=239 RepID=UPI00286E14A5|nr:DUF2490 domain-containing protein [Flavobacterium sp.]
MKSNLFKLLFIVFPFVLLAQTVKEKDVNHQLQTWVSLNGVTKFSAHWAIVADVHLRANDFFQDNNFFLLRGGISYIPNATFSFTGGYAHLWLAPKNTEWNTFADENRVYQQVQMNSKSGKVNIVNRIRNEQRWQEIIINDQGSGKNKFSNRVRYLISTTIPIFKKKTAPLLVVSDELLIQFGKDIVYNTFDQNRFFVGIKQAINPKLSFDFGYMNVYQQKSNGYQYDMDHTLRLFFYLNSSVAHTKL